MSESTKEDAPQALMHDLGLNEAAIERRKTIAGLEAADVPRVKAIGEVVRSRTDEFVSKFFNHLATVEEARQLLANRPLADKARQLKTTHLTALVSGDYGAKYVRERIELGLLYSRAGLDQRAFLGAYNHLLRAIGTAVMQSFEHRPIEGFESFTSLQKVAAFDVGLIVDVMTSERERMIRQQQEAIRELSTPVLQIRDRMLLIPIIGVIDTHRARVITENLLKAIRGNRARVAVMDITGVATIDSRVANHIIQTVAAAKLMGAAVVVTGISPEVAQSLVALGIELSKLNTVGDLQGGLEEAERLLGYQMLRSDRSPAASAIAR